MSGQRHRRLDPILRAPGGLVVAAILGLASAVSMVATYHQMVDPPARHREALKQLLPDVADLASLHRCALLTSAHCKD